MSLLRAAITYALFPLWFVGALGVAVLGHGTDLDPRTLLAGIAVTTAVVVAIFERVNPEHLRWNTSHDDVPTDLLHMGVSQVLIPAAVEAGLAFLFLSFAISASDWLGSPLWPKHWSLAGQVTLAMLVSQFFEYWFHRLSHTTPLLWRLHATHHSPERLYFLNAGRFHPLDTAVSATVSLGSLIFFGAGEGVLLFVSTWIAVHGLFQHCNIRLRLGPLNWIFSMAELHRWHHSRVIDEANNNYGNNILLWDIVFGTVYWPKDRAASEDIGLADMPAFPKTYLAQVLSPFRWRRISGG